jgi:peptide/nickel transport system substrate-binding protein
MVGINDKTKKRFVRRLRHRRTTAVALGQQADQQIERLLIRRFDRLLSVRRFVILWVCLFLLLILAGVLQTRNLAKYYQSLQPVPGGLYTEGLVGNFTDANPLYASGAADTAISRLVFSGLFKYDTSNRLVGDLAKSYSLSADQKRYTVYLKSGLTWQDNVPVTANDVVFTYKTIQNIEAQSPLYSSWQGITVTKQDNYVVNFDLPNALSDFPESLTNGIIPYHLLKNTPVDQMRSAPFNTVPVGTGPFEWKFIETTGSNSTDREHRISLAAFKHYQAGPPKLDGFNLITFSDEQHMQAAFKAKQLTAMSGLETVPSDIANDKGVRVYSIPLTTEVMAFFNNSRPILNDGTIRRALVESVDRSQLNSLFDQPVQLADSPLLKTQLGYDSSLAEPAYNLGDASQLLEQAGWIEGTDGIRTKGGQTLSFTLTAQDTSNYTQAAQFLQKQWARLGAKVGIQYYDLTDLQTSIISNHDYDALLYGINIGIDPDVFAYWDSSQAAITSQGHLNLSEYKSSAVDQAIEAGRTRSDPTIRAVKYRAFLTQWDKDLPALALYQPNYLYVTHGPVFNYERKSANSGADRFYNVDQWMVRQKRLALK